VAVDLTLPFLRSRQPTSREGVRPRDRSERKRLAHHDRVAAQLAELHCIRGLLGDATAVLTTGWVQHDWFAVTDEQGRQVNVTAYDIHLATGRPVAGACLVGALVHAGGGPQAAHTQLVQRSLDLTWHALYEDEHQPVRWCPAPAIRTAHVRDLTRWNDHPARTADQVTELLASATRTAVAQTDRLRSQFPVG
jgi:hypothetical protein